MPPRVPAVRVAAEGPTSATTRLWRFRGQLRVTVIVKATFALVHQGLMKLAPPEPILKDDVHHGNSPVRSVRLTSDLAPYLPATDVLLTGHAYAPAGEPAAWVTAGVGILDGYEPVLEKYLDVRGDMGPEGIQPFQKIPLVYERAFGGPGWEDNPFGVGAGGAKGEPNVFYIGDRRRSAGFGPYSTHWPARKKLVTSDVRRALSEPIAEIPEGFDWTYFHAAPKDQRCPFLTGSEWLVLQGLRPDERRVRTRLPAAKGRALVFWVGEAPEGEPLELIGDTLRIEPDRGVCSVTWRKSFAVAEETDLPDLRVLAGVEIGGQPIAWTVPGAEAAGARGGVVAGARGGVVVGGRGGVSTGVREGVAAGAREVDRPAIPPPGVGRKGRVPTLTLSEADLEVLREEPESPEEPERPERPAAGTADKRGQVESGGRRVAVRALAGTVDLLDRDSAPGPDLAEGVKVPSPPAAPAGPPVMRPGSVRVPSAPGGGVGAPRVPAAVAGKAAAVGPRPAAERQAAAGTGPAAGPRPAAAGHAAAAVGPRPAAAVGPRPAAAGQSAAGPGAPGAPGVKVIAPAAVAGVTPPGTGPLETGPLGMGPLGVRPLGMGPLGMGPLGVRPPVGTDSAEGTPGAMILGSFRLAVFSPDYEEAPDDPLLSTLVIRNKSSPGGELLRSTVRMEEAPPPDSEADHLQRTLVMKGRKSAPHPEPSSPLIQDKQDTYDIDDPSTTLVLRARGAPEAADSGAGGKPLGDLSGAPESTTGIHPGRPVPTLPKAGPAGTLLIDDEDTEDTGPPPPELEPPEHG